MNYSKLDKEIEELEAQFNTPAKEGASETPEVVPVEEKPESKPETTEVAHAASTDEGQRETYEDLKKRYTNLRTASDTFKYRSRQEIASLQERIVALENEIDNVRRLVPAANTDDITRDVFTEEEVNIVGKDAVSIINKAAKKIAEAEAAPLRERIEADRRRRIEEDRRKAVDNKAEAISIFRNRLEELVPDYDTVDHDPRFLTFIQAPDPVNGGTRLSHFKVAEANGIVGVVAGYMNEFKASVSKPVDKLAEKVAPTGKPVAETSGLETKDNTFKLSKINKFYDDVARGKYKGRHSLQIELEAKYDQAFMDDRVVYDV